MAKRKATVFHSLFIAAAAAINWYNTGILALAS